jgi:hypothetical protein
MELVMSELPDDLRALLNLAKDGHDPTDPEAPRRVRHAIAASLLLSTGTGASSSVFPAPGVSNTLTLAKGAKATKAAWVLFGSKVATLTAGTAAVVGLSIASYHYAPNAMPVQPGRPAATLPTPAASAQPEQAPIPRVESAAPAATAVDVPTRHASAGDPNASTKQPHKARPSADDLAAEMALVRAASDALAQGDEQAALTALREHARRFANGNLRVERAGLTAIAECSRDSAPSNASAKRFLRTHPHSLLSARVTKACAVE